MKRVLNVGGNSKAIPLPPQYAGFDHVLLDIDPARAPDIVCDARELATLDPARFDAVYCSHNLEHYYRHDVPKVLAGFLHVLKDGGFAHVRVPDIKGLMRIAVEHDLELEEVIMESPAGPITILDIVYGYGVEIERSGQDFFAHKTGFTRKSLSEALQRAGFSKVHTAVNDSMLELGAVAFKGRADPSNCALFGLPPE